MGVYVITKKEIKDELLDMLEDLDGEVFKKDFEAAAKEVAASYKHFSKE